jgi:uncharacterized protein YwqG
MLIADSDLAQVGRQYLDSEAADAWTKLLRPALHLRALAEGEAVVGYLGGDPLLPADVEWPQWEGQGPLTFVGAIDCGALPVEELELPLPTDGALLFFYFDGQVAPDDDSADEATVDYWRPQSTRGGSRVVYVPADAKMEQRPAPEPIVAYPMVPLAGKPIATRPGLDHPAFRVAFGDPYDPAAPPSSAAVVGDQFSAALDEIRRARAPHHQVGGYAQSVQGSAETEASYGRFPGNDAQSSEDRTRLAGRLVVLAQLGSDTDAGMNWGDGGRLFWLIDPDDLAAGRFDAALFTWQSH